MDIVVSSVEHFMTAKVWMTEDDVDKVASSNQSIQKIGMSLQLYKCLASHS